MAHPFITGLSAPGCGHQLCYLELSLWGKSLYLPQLLYFFRILAYCVQYSILLPLLPGRRWSWIRARINPDFENNLDLVNVKLFSHLYICIYTTFNTYLLIRWVLFTIYSIHELNGRVRRQLDRVWLFINISINLLFDFTLVLKALIVYAYYQYNRLE